MMMMMIIIIIVINNLLLCDLHTRQRFNKGVFIATQLNSTQLNSTELNSTAWTTVHSVCRSWRHKRKHVGCTLFNWLSWV